MKRLLVTAAAMLLVALPSCSDTVAPPDPDPVFGDTLLVGEPGAPAIGAIGDKGPTPAGEDEIDGSFIRTRLTAVVNPTATVEQVNHALLEHGARVSASTAGVPFLVLAIPPVGDEAAARALAADLVATGAFLLAQPESLASTKQFRVLPAAGDTGVSHLVPARLPAAWNVQHAIAARVQVVLPDFYHQLTPIAQVSPLRFPGTGPATRSTGSNHGFHVAGILAADHDSTAFTGAFPSADQIDVDGVSVARLSWPEKSITIANAFPETGNFIVSTSLGYPLGGPFNDSEAFEYATHALHWRMLVANHVDRFLHLTAASNEGDSAGIVGQAFSSSPYNLARFQADLGMYVDGLDVSVLDKAGFAALWLWARVSEPLAVQASPNLVSVGSSDRAGKESSFSSRGSDVRAVGEDVFGPCVVRDPPDSTGVRDPDDCDGTRARYSGTSMATPLVAGIAAYLWALEPSLTPVMLRDILQDAYDDASTTGVLDAYLAVQLLDQSISDGVIRLALLDVASPTSGEVGDGRFDSLDVARFRVAFDDAAQIRALFDSTLVDFGRHDLNGDGVTGDSVRVGPDSTRVGRFDLDADGVLGTVTRVIEGWEREFNERRLEDLDILCYYLYSSLYDDDPDGRRQVAPECSPHCDDPSGGVRASGRHLAPDQCVPPLPDVPPSSVDVEGAGWWFRALLASDTNTEQPGSGDCQNDDQFLDPTAPPVNWQRSGTCTFPGGSVTGRVVATEDDLGRGSARAELSGRFQTTADLQTTATSRSNARVSHHLVVTSTSVPTGWEGVMRARVIVRLRAQIPAFATATPGPYAEARSQFNLSGDFGGGYWTYLDPLVVSLNRGNSTAPTAATGEVTDTLVVPIAFAVDRPIPLSMEVNSSLRVQGQHTQAIDGFAEASYHFLDFLDLPAGSMVRVGSGEEWGVPSTPVPGPARTPLRSSAP